jgi:Apoptosis-antagonizing transcription factor, C-terminal
MLKKGKTRRVFAQDAKERRILTEDRGILAEDPSILAEDPSILAEDPSILAEDPSILAEDASILAEDPSILAEDPSILAKGGKERRTGVEAGSEGGRLGGAAQVKKKRRGIEKGASKGRKLRYDVHEKLVNFMAPTAADLPPMAAQLFSNLFGAGAV